MAGLGASALLHVGLVPEHFEEAPGYGLFFAVAGLALAVAAAAAFAWPARPVYLGGTELLAAGACLSLWLRSDRPAARPAAVV